MWRKLKANIDVDGHGGESLEEHPLQYEAAIEQVASMGSTCLLLNLFFATKPFFAQWYTAQEVERESLF